MVMTHDPKAEGGRRKAEVKNSRAAGAENVDPNTVEIYSPVIDVHWLADVIREARARRKGRLSAPALAKKIIQAMIAEGMDQKVAERRRQSRPVPPPHRSVCDACGPLVGGKHRGL